MTSLEEIKARCPAEVLATRDNDAIAAAASVGRVKIVSTPIGVGDVLAALGEGGGPFLDGLVALGETNRNVYWSLVLIQGGRLDVGMAATRAQVEALAATNPGIAAATAALLALAERPDPLTEFDVRCALWSVDGEWLGG